MLKKDVKKKNNVNTITCVSKIYNINEFTPTSLMVELDIPNICVQVRILGGNTVLHLSYCKTLLQNFI